jgi:hypothetical protein
LQEKYALNLNRSSWRFQTGITVPAIWSDDESFMINTL